MADANYLGHFIVMARWQKKGKPLAFAERREPLAYFSTDSPSLNGDPAISYKMNHRLLRPLPCRSPDSKRGELDTLVRGNAGQMPVKVTVFPTTYTPCPKIALHAPTVRRPA